MSTRNTLSIDVRISTESLENPSTVATLTIPPLNAARVGCSDIEKILPEDFEGELVEGFFHISRFSSDLKVQAVYSYTRKGLSATRGPRCRAPPQRGRFDERGSPHDNYAWAALLAARQRWRRAW